MTENIEKRSYPGPFCEELGIQTSALLATNVTFDELPGISPKNGLILELVHFAAKQKFPNRKVANWLQLLFPKCIESSIKTVESRISRTLEAEKRFKKKKKNATYKSVEEFQRALFVVNSKKIIECENTKLCPSPLKESKTKDILPNPVKETDITETLVEKKQCIPPVNGPHHPIPDSVKNSNQKRYEISKQQKKLNVLKNLVQKEKESLEHLKKVQGHFSVRNVTKRDENAKKTRKALHSLKSSHMKQKRLIETLNSENLELRCKLQKYQSDNSTLLDNNERLKEDSYKKTKAQKLVSYYRGVIQKIRHTDQSENMKRQLKKKQDEIDYLVDENETLKEEQNHCVTKNENGSFSNNLRLCVMELFALEIGMEKIPYAIEAVCRHLFNYTFKKQDLPTLTTVRNIIDEGHYLAKSFIATKIENAENIGISRDGTTRKKEKIVDTSVTLNTGEIMSLGFTKVARETAEVINNVTKSQITELAETVAGAKRENCTEKQRQITVKFVADSLEKLSFTMSDRANNEKLADKLLHEWRDSVLENCENESEKQTVFQFHCMAHVLLGFHRYVADDLKKYEKEFTASEGPIGRDRLPFFKFWSKKQSVPERIAYTASDVFGPAGDHLGLRDRWEAFCASNGIKSVIGNYRDNRFNSLFQTSAEVFLHRDSFLEVIKTAQNPNQKILSVEADLQSEAVNTMLRALTTVYVKITGPYWWLVTSGKVSYLQLHPHVRSLENFLEECAENPGLLNENTTWINDEDLLVPHLEKFQTKLSNPVPYDQSELYHNLLNLICKALLRTVRKQLVDFLEGGRYSTMPSTEDLRRTSFAQVNNLACEHHFGDLDASQRRRPNATFHHHSSVQMLKRNRRQLIGWLSDMPVEQQRELMKKARKGGISLRKRHREQEENVQLEVLEMMENGQKSKRRKVVERDVEKEDYENEAVSVKDILPNLVNGFNDNEYIAVAYQDSWYPGCVIKTVSSETASVTFMTPCRKPGTFMWPSRKDIQVVEKQFVLRRGMVPECCNSGRQWYFPDYKFINELFEKYKDSFFN